MARTESGLEHTHQSLERLGVAILIRIGPVDQKQIDIVQAQSFQARLAGLANALDAMPLPIEFGGDEDVFTPHTGGADAFADAALIAVVLGGVD